MSVCDNQDQFNTALKTAVKYTEDKRRSKEEPSMIIYTIVWSMFLIWAVILAMKVKDKTQEIIHLVLAMIVSPIYVISYYVSGMYRE